LIRQQVQLVDGLCGSLQQANNKRAACEGGGGTQVETRKWSENARAEAVL